MQKLSSVRHAAPPGVRSTTAPVEAARIAKARGAKVVAVTSEAYSRQIANGRPRIADLADELGLEGVLIGSTFGACHTRFTKLESTEKAKEYFAKNKPADQTILIKGSRGMRLEGLVELL